MYIYMYVCMYVCIHTYIHTYIHIYTYIYNNVINILFIKAMYESHQVSVFKQFTFKIIAQNSNNLNSIFYL